MKNVICLLVFITFSQAGILTAQDTLIFIDSTQLIGYVDEYRDNGILFTRLDERSSYLFAFGALEEIRLGPDSPFFRKKNITDKKKKKKVQTHDAQKVKGNQIAWIQSPLGAKRKGRLVEVREDGILWYNSPKIKKGIIDSNWIQFIPAEQIEELHFRDKDSPWISFVLGYGMALGMLQLGEATYKPKEYSGWGGAIQGLNDELGRQTAFAFGGMVLFTTSVLIGHDKKKYKIRGSKAQLKLQRNQIAGFSIW